jgi:hypothetical protein
MSPPLYHVFDCEDLALARQKEIDDASGFPCYVQGYTFPEGEPVPVWTEHAESVRAHPDGTKWAIAATDLAGMLPIEALDVPSPDESVFAPSEIAPEQTLKPDRGGGKLDVRPQPVTLAEPIELDDSWNGVPKT